MFKKSLFALLLALSSSHTSHALTQATFPADVQNELFSETSTEEATPITSSLKLVGRGIRNRTTGEVIALACMGANLSDGTPSCKKIRYVHYDPRNQSTQLIGGEIRVYTKNNVEPDEKRLRELMSEINGYVTELKKDAHRSRNGTFITALGIAWGGEGAYIVAVGMATGPGLLLAIGSLGAVLGIQELVLRPSFLTKNGTTSQAMLNKDGWNWSTKPKNVSEKTYGWLKTFIDRNSVTWAQGED